MKRIILIACCLALAGCSGHVDFRSSSVRYQGSPGPLAVAALGVVMGFELARLAAPAFRVKGTKPGTVGRATAMAGPNHGTLILMAALTGPAMDTDLDKAALALVEGLMGLGLETAPAPEFDVPAPGDTDNSGRDQRRVLGFSNLVDRGYARVLVCALGPGPGQDTPMRVTIVDLADRKRTELGDLGGPTKDISPQDLERIYLKQMPEAALLMATALEGAENRN